MLLQSAPASQKTYQGEERICQTGNRTRVTGSISVLCVPCCRNELGRCWKGGLAWAGTEQPGTRTVMVSVMVHYFSHGTALFKEQTKMQFSAVAQGGSSSVWHLPSFRHRLSHLLRWLCSALCVELTARGSACTSGDLASCQARCAVAT